MNGRALCALLIVGLAGGCARENAEQLQIREQRRISNEALRNRDIELFSSQWIEDFTLISSRGNVVIGAKANYESYASMFDQDGLEWYERTPDKVSVMPGWGIATEYGHWKGEFEKNDDTYKVSGQYIAKWVKKGRKWMIHSEAYSPEKCEGGIYCNEHLYKE